MSLVPANHADGANAQRDENESLRDKIEDLHDRNENLRDEIDELQSELARLYLKVEDRDDYIGTLKGRLEREENVVAYWQGRTKEAREEKKYFRRKKEELVDVYRAAESVLRACEGSMDENVEKSPLGFALKELAIAVTRAEQAWSEKEAGQRIE